MKKLIEDNIKNFNGLEPLEKEQKIILHYVLSVVGYYFNVYEK